MRKIEKYKFQGTEPSVYLSCMRSITLALILCTIRGFSQDLPAVPGDEIHISPKAIKGIQPDDLALPAVVMTFGMLIAGNFMVSDSWGQNELVIPVLVTCGTVAAITIPLSVSARNSIAKRQRDLAYLK